MSLKRVLHYAIIGFVLGIATQAQAATSQVEMLREMFRKPASEWKQVMQESRALLDANFFENVEKRVRWGIENNHVDDAFRFAMVGDFGSEVKGRPANYRIDLAELFLKAENRTMTGQIVDNILLTSPGTPAARRAMYLRGELYEMDKQLYQAHQAFRELAESGYKPADTWYKAGQISLFIQEEKRGLEELKRAKEAGNLEAGVLYEKLVRQLQGDWTTSFEPLPNREGIDTRTGVQTPAVKDAASLVAEAKKYTEDGDLDSALSRYREAYSMNPADPDVVRGYGALLYRRATLEEAQKFLDQALQANPTDAELYRIRANTLERLYDRKKDRNLLKQALEDYKKGLELSPTHSFMLMEYERAKAK